MCRFRALDNSPSELEKTSGTTSDCRYLTTLIEKDPSSDTPAFHFNGSGRFLKLKVCAPVSYTEATQTRLFVPGDLHALGLDQ